MCFPIGERDGKEEKFLVRELVEMNPHSRHGSPHVNLRRSRAVATIIYGSSVDRPCMVYGMVEVCEGAP